MTDGHDVSARSAEAHAGAAPQHAPKDSGAQRRGKRASFWRQLPLLLLLIVVWVLLWDTISWLSIIGGIVLAVLVVRVFHLPAVELGGRVNVPRLVWFLVRQAAQMFGASLQVAWQAFDWRSTPRNAIIAVPLHTTSDLILTWTGQAVSLIPGSIIVEADREEGRLYLHTLNTATPEALERVRRGVLDTEEAIVLALGSPEEVRIVRAERAARRAADPGRRSAASGRSGGKDA